MKDWRGQWSGGAASFEYRSRLRIGRLPLVHVVRGIDPTTGRRPPAVGVIAVGQIAIGIVAVGQVALGAISVGQAAIGLGWGIGQAACGLLAAGQIAAGMLGAVGQIALGPRALGMVNFSGAWVSIGWLLGGACLLAGIARRRRRLAPLLAQPWPSTIRAVGNVGEVGNVDNVDRTTEDARSRRRAGHLDRSPARPAVGLALRLLAHRRGEPGGAAPRARRRRGDDRRRDGRRARRSRRPGPLHPQRQLPRDRRARLGAAPRDVARRRGRGSRRRAGHAGPRSRRRWRSPRWRLAALRRACRPAARSSPHETRWPSPPSSVSPPRSPGRRWPAASSPSLPRSFRDPRRRGG